jgi:hypothetical protein
MGDGAYKDYRHIPDCFGLLRRLCLEVHVLKYFRTF